jgi:hypothetical protein
MPEFKPLDLTTIEELKKPKKAAPKQPDLPRINHVPGLFSGGYLDGIERMVPDYYVIKGLLYRTIDINAKPYRGMPLDELFGSCSSYKFSFTGTDGTNHFELVDEGR